MTDTQQEHTLTPIKVESSLPSQISAGGDLTYGKERQEPLQRNLWSSRLFNPWCFTTFAWSTSTALDASYVLNLHSNNDRLSYIQWLCQFAYAYQLEFDIEFRFIAHSAHRGRLAVSITGSSPSPDHKEDFFLPLTMIDISGGAHSHIISVPNMFSTNQKLNQDSFNARLIPQRPEIPRDTLFHELDINFGTLSIKQVTPLMASSMLPSSIIVLVLIHPKPNTFKLFGSIRPSGTTDYNIHNTV